MLLQKGADPTGDGPNGDSPLQLLLRLVPFIIILFSDGCSKHMVTQDKKEWFDVFRMMLDSGALIHRKNSSGGRCCT